MAKTNLEIKKIRLDNVEIKDVTSLELKQIAKDVETRMLKIQSEKGVINTLNQALMVALEYASQSYSSEQREGGQKRDEEQRVTELIHRIKTRLDI